MFDLEKAASNDICGGLVFGSSTQVESTCSMLNAGGKFERLMTYLKTIR